MIYLFTSVVCIGLLKFFISVANKTGLREWASLRVPNSYYQKLIDCDFCLGFRILFILSLTIKFYFNFDWLFVFLNPMVLSGILTLFDKE